jgi:hypothetical protein
MPYPSATFFKPNRPLYAQFGMVRRIVLGSEPKNLEPIRKSNWATAKGLRDRMRRTPAENAEGEGVFGRNNAATSGPFSAPALLCSKTAYAKLYPKKAGTEPGTYPHPQRQVENATAPSAPSAGGSPDRDGKAWLGKRMAFRTTST